MFNGVINKVVNLNGIPGTGSGGGGDNVLITADSIEYTTDTTQFTVDTTQPTIPG